VAPALAVLAGCNWVYGSDRVSTLSTPNIDAQYFDAPIDAPPMCGSGAPQFKQELNEVIVPSNCQHFSVSDNGMVVAICQPTLFMNLFAGMATDPDGLQLMVNDLPSDGQPTQVRIAPEGDFALIQIYRAFDDDFYHAVRVDPATNIWHDLGPITAIDPHMTSFLSTPTRGPDRHLLTWSLDSGFTEYLGDGVDWTAQVPYISPGFGSISNAFGLTPDGLRLVAQAGVNNSAPSARYGVRTDMSQPFMTSTPLPEPASIQEPYLTEDCGKLYFFGLERVLYVKQ
jgi:hypothetical protein